MTSEYFPWIFYQCPRCQCLREKREILWDYLICSECHRKLVFRELHWKEIDRYYKANSIELISRIII